jgi:DNA-binding NarL/FixJ family response regulator
MTNVMATGQSAERVDCPVLVLNPLIEDLTKEELQALKFAACGLTAKDTAKALFLAEITVKTYLATARLKLGARNTVQAVAMAMAGQLIKFDTNMAHGPIN